MLASILSYLVGLGRYKKRVALAIVDLILLNLALWLAMSARWGHFYLAPTWHVFLLLAATPLLAIAAFFQVRLYRHVTRHFGSEGTQLMAICISVSALALGLGAFLVDADGIPRSVLFLYPLFGTLLLWGARRILQVMIQATGVTLPPSVAPHALRNVMIYGANQEGRAAVSGIRMSPDLAVVGFVDPDPNLWRQYVDSVRVYPPARLPDLIKSLEVRQVLLATRHASRRDRLEAADWLANCPVDVRVLPAVEDIASGRISVRELRQVQADDLLGRPPIPPDVALLERAIHGKSVLVTGAGGSIGSELVRQILKHTPRTLVMLDASEANLFTIGLEVDRLLRWHKSPGSPVTQAVTVLGSVTDERLVENALRTHGVQAIYHAAAFKHVPLLESNPMVGLRNNVIGTEVLADAAERCAVEQFVLISTDKAVRPSSLMGASKRVAELLLQARAAQPQARTVFAIVRFGNVVDSSGSAVQLFRRQIESGGPVTVTHPDMVRYFISIPEAAALVIQAGAMAKGGEIFALEMGEPVRIVDLAKLMIQLSGKQLRDDQNPDGEVEIMFTGMRPGEKLIEELHSTGQTAETEHPRIMRITEPHLSVAELAARIELLKAAMHRDDVRAARETLAGMVEE